MGVNDLVSLFTTFGVNGVVIILFFWQYIEQRNTNKEREEKLYSVIDKLAEQLPEIKESIKKIENKLYGG